MKILIWFLCVFAYGIISAILKENGIMLGGIPTFLLLMLMFGIARTLGEKWEEHKNNKQKNITATVKTIDKEDNEINDKITFCRKCGFKLIDDSEFCSQCGTKIV